jgi:hypothetical protein
MPRPSRDLTVDIARELDKIDRKGHEMSLYRERLMLAREILRCNDWALLENIRKQMTPTADASPAKTPVTPNVRRMAHQHKELASA